MYSLKIIVKQDDGTVIWIAIKDAIGLAIEADAVDALLDRLKIAIPEQMEANMISKLESRQNSE